MPSRSEALEKPSAPKALLHGEGLVVLCAACVWYHHFGYSWGMFAILFLAPDLAMVGFAFGPKVGAWAYNAGHTYLAVAALWLAGHFARFPVAQPLCLIWLAHIGFDRLLGYGLKYASGFKDTHLGRV